MSFSEVGFELIDGFLTAKSIDKVLSELDELAIEPGRVGGLRNAEKKLESVKELVYSDCVLKKVGYYLSGTPNLVRAILFIKSPDNNWLVTWHQDKTIAVSDQFEMTGWGPWSVKDGIHHVQPTIDVLNRMVTFRIHLDEVTKENGCLKVIPGSHQDEKMTQERINRYVQSHKADHITGRAGSALAMRPHLLHASSKSNDASYRRVLHVEYSDYVLPDGITWI